jgi:hypothetical protein
MRINQTRWADLLLFISIIFGAILRFAPTIISGLPINDGGMFYVMIQDLKINHFQIPAFTSYNHILIPFAYPPLSFYMGGLLSYLGIPILEIIRWIPPLVSTLSIPAFYWMASLILNSKTKAVLATMAYAMIPRSFSWFVMGGGLSRSFGVFFLLLACASTWLLFARQEKKYIMLSAFFGAGAILSHPETGLHTLAACALIWLFKGRTALGVRNASLVVLGVFVLISPWLGSVLSQHGMEPFLSAIHAGGHDPFFWTPWITFDFAEERFATLFTVLSLFGLVVQIIRRDWFLPIWLLSPFIVEPRSAPAIAAIPLVMLAGIGLSDFVIPNILTIASKTIDKNSDWTIYMAGSRAIRIVHGYVLFSALIGGFYYDLSLARIVVTIKSRDAMRWTQNNTPSNSRFIVLTDGFSPFSDPIVEWFPAFTSRISQNTIQGKEWLLGSDFTSFRDQIGILQSCLNDTPLCVENWANLNHIAFDYIYIEKSMDHSTPGLLIHVLKQDPRYVQIYENEAVVIFGRK